MADAGTAYVQIRGDLSHLNKQLVANLAPQRLRKFGLLAGAGLAAGFGGAAVGKGLFDLGKSFDDQFDKIRTGTGKTGVALQGLEDDFKDVAKGVPADFDSVGTAVTELHRRLGLTGKPLRSFATQLVNLSRITKTDLATNIEEVARAFEDWEVPVKEQTKALDGLFRLGQRSGIAVSDLASKVQKFGSPLRILGFSLGEAAATFATFERAGVNTQKMVPGLNLAISNLTRPSSGLATQMDKLGIAAGKPEEGLKKVFALLGDGSNLSKVDKIGLAMDVFGKRAGADMAEAIRQGRFEVDEMFKTFSGGGDTINKAERDTRDFSEEWQLFKNRLAVGLQPLATDIFESVGKIMKIIGDPNLSGSQKWDRISDIIVPAFEKALQGASDAAVKYGPKIAGALFKGFLNAPPLIQILTGAFLLKKAGPMLASAGLLGRQAGGAFSTGMATTVAAQTGAGGAAGGAAAGGLAGFGKRLARFAKVGVGVAVGAAVLEGIRLRLDKPDAGLRDRLKQLQAPGVLGTRKIIGGAQNLVAKIPGIGGPAKGDFGFQLDKSKELQKVLDQINTASGSRVGVLQRQAAELAHQLDLTKEQKEELASIFKLKATTTVSQALGGLTQSSRDAQDSLPAVVAAQKRVNDLRKQGRTDTHAYAVAIRALDEAEAVRTSALASRSAQQRKALDGTRADLSAAKQTLADDRRLGASQEQLRRDMMQVAQAASRQEAALANVSRAVRGLTPITGSAGTKMGALLKQVKGFAGADKFKKFLITADVSSVTKGIGLVGKLKDLVGIKRVMRIFADSKTPEEALRKLGRLAERVADRKYKLKLEAEDNATRLAEKLKRTIDRLPEKKKLTFEASVTIERELSDLLQRTDRGPAAKQLRQPRAKGGTVRRGEMSLVGEEGPELVELPAGTRVHPHGKSKTMAKRMGIPGFAKGGTVKAQKKPKRKSLYEELIGGDEHAEPTRNVRSTLHQAWDQTRPLLHAPDYPMPAVYFRRPDTPALATTGPGRSGLDAVIAHPVVRKGLARGAAQALRVIIHEWAHTFQLETANDTQLEGGADAFARRALRPVADAIGFKGADEALEKHKEFRSTIKRLKERRGKHLETFVRDRQFGFRSTGTSTKAGEKTQAELGDELWYESDPRQKKIVRAAGKAQKAKTIPPPSSIKDWKPKVAAGVRAAGGGGLISSAWRGLKPHLPKTKRAQRKPTVNITDEQRGEYPVGYPTGGYGQINLPRWSLAALRGGGDVPPDLNDWAKSMVVHEFVHGVQSFDTLKEPALREGGAVLFGEKYQGGINGANFRSTGQYRSWANQVEKDRGPKWVNRGQFLPDPDKPAAKKAARRARGGWVRELLSLVGEQGPELVKSPGGKQTVVGREGPEVRELLPGTRVFSHPESIRKLAFSGESFDSLEVNPGQVIREAMGIPGFARGGVVKREEDRDPTARGKGQPDRGARGSSGEVPYKAPKVKVASVPGGILSRANKLDSLSLPYKWGGGHGNTAQALQKGFDCSGAVSYVLGIPARVSGRFDSWGKPGPGEVATYSNPKHIVMSIGEKMFGTGDGTGPHWLKGGPAARFSSAFTTRHIGQAGARESFKGAGKGKEDEGPKYRHHGKYTLGQMVTLARRAGFPDPALAAAVGYAESRGDTAARNKSAIEDSRGLWQINVKENANPKYKDWDLSDAFRNAKAAFEVSKGGRTFKPWSVYTQPPYPYKEFLGGRAAPLPKGTGAASGSTSRLSDYLAMRLYDAEQDTPLDKKDDLRWINRALKYWRGVRKRNLGVGNWSRAQEAKEHVVELVGKKVAIRKGDVEEKELLNLPESLAEIGKPPNTFKLTAFDPELGKADLAFADALLTIPPDSLSEAQAQPALTASLQDDKVAAERLRDIWTGIHTVVSGFDQQKPRPGGRMRAGQTFTPTPQQSKQLSQTKNQPERIGLLNSMIAAAKQGFLTDSIRIEGTAPQKVEAATQLKGARDTLKSIMDEAYPKGEAPESTQGPNPLTEITNFLKSIGALFKDFGPNFRSLPSFHQGGTIQGPPGSDQIIRAQAGEIVLPNGERLQVEVKQSQQSQQPQVINNVRNIDVNNTYAEGPAKPFRWSRDLKYEIDAIVGG